jgi:hypothetical protein
MAQAQHRQSNVREGEPGTGDQIAALPAGMKFLFEGEKRLAMLEQRHPPGGNIGKVPPGESHFLPGVSQCDQGQADSVRSSHPEALDRSYQ